MDPMTKLYASQLFCVLQTSDEDSDGEMLIGPIPSKDAVESSVVADIERRSNRMKEKLVSGDMVVTPSNNYCIWHVELYAA